MFTIDNKIFEWASISENQLLEEIAIMLYKKRKLTFGQAAQTAKLNYAEFQYLLGQNQIEINYEISDLLDDIDTINKISKNKNGNH